MEQCEQPDQMVRTVFTVWKINEKIRVLEEIPEVNISESPMYFFGKNGLHLSFPGVILMVIRTLLGAFGIVSRVRATCLLLSLSCLGL